MYQIYSKRDLRASLLLGAASIAAIGFAGPALAQQSGQVETVVVTGSRIPQQGIYASSPVTAVGQQEMKFEGTTDVTTLINNLPAAFMDQNSGVSNGATGTANVDLRGLGSKRTLVLVNGTRLMPSDPAVPVADLNNIPAALVDHVEVLTGGASAVYGSDALAGVVNFIMRKDFEGIEFDGTYSVTQNDNSNSYWRNIIQGPVSGGSFGFAEPKENIWNGQTVDGTFLIGVNSPNGKGNITGYFGYRSVAPVLEATRDYSECTIQSTGPGFACNGSSNYNRWFSYDNLFYDIAQGGAVSYDFFECSARKTPSCGAGTKGTFVPYTGAQDQRFNYGAVNYFQRSDTRYTGGFFAHYQENNELDIYSSFMFADDNTTAQIAQSGLFLGSGRGLSGTVYTNCSNPIMTANENVTLCGQLPGDAFVPSPNFPAGGYWNGAGNIPEPIPGQPGQYFNPGAVPGQSQLLIGRRDLEGGDRQAVLRHTAYRMQIGARGDLGDGWSYDAYGQYGLTLFQQGFFNEFSKTRVQNALEVDPATGKCYTTEQVSGDPTCVALDLFNGFGAITPSMLHYVTAHGLQEGWTEESVVSGSVTGDLGQWGGQSPWAKNPIGVSFGSEYRQERLKLDVDQEFATFDMFGQGGAVLPVPASGFNVTEGFTEVKVPLVQEMPFVEDLTLNGGYRYSSYNISGATSTFKYGFEWQPVDDVRIRGGVQRAVRAPNVLELFAPANVILFGGQDPCAFSTAGNCAGVPNAGNAAILACPASQCNQQVAGNIHLKPETSDTHTIGVVFTPTFIDGFTATMDWFDIKVSNFISTLPPQEILNECYLASQSYFCQFVHRNGTGQVWSTGFVAAPNLNTGYLQTQGVDYEFNYQTDTANWWGLNAGSLAFNDVGTWLDTLVTEPIPIGPQTTSIAATGAFNCAGLYGPTCGVPAPKWRNRLRVTWSTPWDVDISLAWRYIGAVGLDYDTSTSLIGGGPTTFTCKNGVKVPFNSSNGIYDCADSRISSFSYFDLSGDWTVREGVDLRAGVNNIFDIEPPVIGLQALPVFGNGNTVPGTYDALGRTIFVAATLKY